MGLPSRAEAEADNATWRRAFRTFSEERAARLVRAAEYNAEAAAGRYRALRVAASEAAACLEGGAPRRPLSTWQQLLLVILCGGLLAGSLVMWLIATAYVGPVALLVLPPAAVVVVGFVVLMGGRRSSSPRTRRRPVVADLVRAAKDVQDAEAALRRARARAGAAQDRPVPDLPPVVAAPGVSRDRVPWPRSHRGAQQA